MMDKKSSGLENVTEDLVSSESEEGSKSNAKKKKTTKRKKNHSLGGN